ncbi:unnamed protein product [Caretta caretta]
MGCSVGTLCSPWCWCRLFWALPSHPKGAHNEPGTSGQMSGGYCNRAKGRLGIQVIRESATATASLNPLSQPVPTMGLDGSQHPLEGKSPCPIHWPSEPAPTPRPGAGWKPAPPRGSRPHVPLSPSGLELAAQTGPPWFLFQPLTPSAPPALPSDPIYRPKSAKDKQRGGGGGARRGPWRPPFPPNPAGEGNPGQWGRALGRAWDGVVMGTADSQAHQGHGRVTGMPGTCQGHTRDTGESRTCQANVRSRDMPRTRETHGHTRGMGDSRVCQGHAKDTPGTRASHGYAKHMLDPETCQGNGRLMDTPGHGRGRDAQRTHIRLARDRRAKDGPHDT